MSLLRNNIQFDDEIVEMFTKATADSPLHTDFMSQFTIKELTTRYTNSAQMTIASPFMDVSLKLRLLQALDQCAHQQDFDIISRYVEVIEDADMTCVFSFYRDSVLRALKYGQAHRVEETLDYFSSHNSKDQSPKFHVCLEHALYLSIERNESVVTIYKSLTSDDEHMELVDRYIRRGESDPLHIHSEKILCASTEQKDFSVRHNISLLTQCGYKKEWLEPLLRQLSDLSINNEMDVVSFITSELDDETLIKHYVKRNIEELILSIRQAKRQAAR